MCTKSPTFTLSFAEHSCSLLDISSYPRIGPDEDQCSSAQGEWPLARASMTIDSVSLGARPTSGLVQWACSVYGRVPTFLFVLFPVV